ncbi:hypothetical protein ABT369_39250 [Dactylosporangium sp. NPDC000244]|uniref:hypothetical protein n=1 Tax=Dactylosporangium sp. NPDC000244 TaxID=3154365 RepID=UPI00332F127A
MTAWRTIITDSESLTGVAPVCDRQDDPSGPHCGDTGRQITDWVFDCCPHPHIEVWNETTAATLAQVLTASEAELCS